MPRVWRTVIPRIKKSIRERGLGTSLARSFLLPIHLLDEYRTAKSLRRNEANRSEFDLTHGVDTDSDFEEWTHLSDLNIPSPNWLDGNPYLPIEPERFRRVMTSLDIEFETYTFIDFGSGKGRGLLLASEFPFRRVIGLEFSPELHSVAESNIRRCEISTRVCRDVQSINLDFVRWVLPPEPLVLFFFDPCRGRVFSEVMTRIGQSLRECPRPLYVAYVAPRLEQERLFASCGFLEEVLRNAELNFCICRGVSNM